MSSGEGDRRIEDDVDPELTVDGDETEAFKTGTEDPTDDELRIEDVVDRHIENFKRFQREAVDEMMTEYNERAQKILDESQRKRFELQQLHEFEDKQFEEELIQLKELVFEKIKELEEIAAKET